MHEPSSINTTDVAATRQHKALYFKKKPSVGQIRFSRSNVFNILSAFFVLLAGVLFVPSPRLSAVVHQSQEEETISAFFNWFQDGGGKVSNKIAIQPFPILGRGVLALQLLKSNDELLFVPKRLIICYDTIAENWSSNSKLLSNLAILKSAQDELLTAFLLVEQAKGHASRWAPYLQLLPTQSDVATPLFFAIEDIDALQDEHMIIAAKEEIRHATNAYNQFWQLFHSFFPEETMTLLHYKWARFLVNSRAFSIQGQRVLVPFGDMFNGKPDDKDRQHDNGQHFLHHHQLQADGMSIRAGRDTFRGQQVFEDYGDNSNYIYFLYHGFLMQDNGFDCATIRLPRLAEAYAQVKDYPEQRHVLVSKSHILSRLGIEDGPHACISRTGKLEDSDSVRLYMALYNMSDDHVTACINARAFSECFPPDLMPNFDAKSGQNEKSLLLGFVKQQINSYATSLEKDLDILDKSPAKSTSFSHAVTFRVSRKQILQSAQITLEQELTSFQLESDHHVVSTADVVLHKNPHDDKLERYQQWLLRHDFPVNELELRYVNASVGYGAFAAKSLATGDVYLQVPVHLVMNVQSGGKSRWVSQTMQALQTQRVNLPSEDLVLLLHLLEEKFGPTSLDSKWRPYLDMLPAERSLPQVLSSPLFYEQDGEQLKALEGTDLLALVSKYRHQVDEVSTLVSNHCKPDRTCHWLTKSRFRWATAILDSRTIWWHGQRHLVPLLDMVNCHEVTRTHLPHFTTLDPSGDYAITKASWDFQAGQQVVENYAQPNYVYLLYHGFVLESNSYDCAHFHLELPIVTRHLKFRDLRQRLGMHSRTFDVCVAPTDTQSVSKFVKMALLVSKPYDALKFAANKATLDTEIPPQAIAAALGFVDERLRRLQLVEQTLLAGAEFRTQSIKKYRQQQVLLLATLRTTLQALANVGCKSCNN